MDDAAWNLYQNYSCKLQVDSYIEPSRDVIIDEG